MTHPASTIEEALALRSRGLIAREIAEVIHVPRSTVSYWIVGRLPRQLTGRNTGCASCGHTPHRFKELPPSYAYLLGLYLGDGYIATHERGVFRLRITLDARYPRIIKEAADAMRGIMPLNKVNTLATPRGYVEVSSYSKAWPCLFPQHGPGKKHLRAITLTEWQDQLVARWPRLLLRGLIHSDGSRFMNTGREWSYPRYSFSNLSPDIWRIFCQACDLLGVRWTMSRRCVYVSRNSDVAEMDRFIGPKA